MSEWMREANLFLPVRRALLRKQGEQGERGAQKHSAISEAVVKGPWAKALKD